MPALSRGFLRFVSAHGCRGPVSFRLIPRFPASRVDLSARCSGRRTYDNSITWWGADGPTGDARIPLFVVSHSTPGDVPADGVYTFVGDIRAAMDAARAAAGDADIGIMGGADIARQYLRAGLVDEISIHLMPVLFGSGTPLFGEGEWLDEHVPLERTECIVTDTATHLRFRVVK